MLIESELCLPVPEVSGESLVESLQQPPLRVTLADAPELVANSKNVECQRYYNLDGELWLELQVAKDETRAVLASVASYVYLRQEHQLLVSPKPDTDPQIVAHYVQAFAIPMVSALNGLIVLHASAVVRNNSAVIFVGPSGSGKSTAAYLASTRGYQIIADDFVVVSSKAGIPQVWGSTTNVRLRSDTLELVAQDDKRNAREILTKTLIEGGRLRTDGFAICKIVFLDDMQKTPRGQESFRSLLNQLFFGFILSSDATQAQFQLLARLVEIVPFVSISSHSNEQLEECLVL